MSLIQFLRILAARRAIIIATLLACVITATIAAEVLPPRYQAKSRVLIDLTKPDPVSGQLLASNTMGNYIATQMKLIKDVQTAGPVVDQLGWATDPNIVARYEAAGSPGNDIREWLAEDIVANTDAKFVEGSNIIEITYTGTDPENAQRIADAVRDAFLQQNLQDRRRTAARGAKWYRDQADKALKVVATAEEERTAYAKANGIVLQPDNTDLESSKLAALSAQSAAPSLPQMSAGSSPASMQLEALKAQIAQAATTLGPNHPTYQALERQRQLLESQVAKGGGPRMIGGTSQAQIEASYQAQKSRVLAQRDKVDRLNQMQQDIGIKRDQYQKLAEKADELRGQAEVGDTNLEALGVTSRPAKPSWPNKPLIIFGSIALGALLGVLLALLVELLARRVRSDEDLEYAADAPVLGIIESKRHASGWGAKLADLIDRKGAARRRALAEG